VFEQEEEGNAFYIVLEGRVLIYKYHDS
jgi:CRP-like cAMP-binding protein